MRLTQIKSDESGLALLMVTFVIALSSVLVLNLSQENLFHQQSSRGYVESVQADFILKSSINLARDISRTTARNT